jgi:intein/homing endonuclease
MTRDQVLIESSKCIKSTPYCLKTYLQTYDNTIKKYVPLDLFPDQIKLVEDFDTYNENIALKYRQAGVSTVTAAWASKRLAFANKNKPEKILIIANKLDTAVEMANKVRHFIEQWPKWVGIGFSSEKNSARHFKLNNDCEVKAVATSKDALRGYTPTILIFDEAAYIDADSDFWAASMASLSCVHEDSYIFTDNGILQLKDIISEKNNIGFTKYDGTIKVVNKDKEIVDIKNTFKSERATCYNIKTKFGYELTGSFKHPLLVNTNADNDEWVWMENMKVGDKIKLQFDQNLFGKNQEIQFDLKHYNETEKYKLPSKLSDDLDLCYLMGLFIAEGNYNDNTIAITNGDDEIINFLTNMGFLKSREHHYYYSSSYLTRFFQNYIGITKARAKDKKIPPMILRSSKEVAKAFLQGMFDGDGCAFKTGVKYTSTSKELVNQLQILLLNFGIQSYIKYTEEKTSQTSVLTNKNHISKIYNLFIKNQYIERFFNEIGFRLSRKQIKQDSYKNKIKNSQTIYATKDELKTILNENGIKRSQYEKEFRFMDGLLRQNKKTITLHAIERLFEKNLPNKTTLSIWEKRYENLKSYFYDEIIQIDSFEDDTYDLEIPDGHSFVSNGIISHNTGGKVVVISTPNGYDPIYYEIYDQALRNMNEFKITEMVWFRDPRYTKDLFMVKTKDMIHYLLNKDEYKNEDDIINLSTEDPYNRDNQKVIDYIEEGYKPCSSWYEGMVKKLKYDKRKVSQEIESNFLGSGDNVFDSNMLMDISKNMLANPISKLMGNSLWIFKEPENGHRYVAGVDVSRGDSEDFSTIQIIDFDTQEQVLEYVGKIPPDILAEIVYKWCLLYKAFVVVDLTGGMGVATSRKLQELSYPNLYYDNIEPNNKWKFDPKANERIPGINFNNKRVQMIASFEEALRHDFKIYSNRLYNEMNTFIYINGRPDHQKGHHDDCIMAIAMATYVAEKSFQSLEKVANHTKAMINSWSSFTNQYNEQSLFFNPITASNNKINNNPSLNDYQKYNWLFGAGLYKQ